MTFAFSLIFYPPEDSVFVALDLLNGSTSRLRLCRVYPVVLPSFSEWLGWVIILRQSFVPTLIEALSR